MKINSLWVSEYKNVKDLTFTFKSDLITLLVGHNGLGKSNLIEVLAIIFRDIDLLDQKKDYDDWPYRYFEARISYECYKEEIKLELLKGQFKIFAREKGSDSSVSFEEVLFSDFIKFRNKRFLPKYIIGYYSGENKRIRDIIREHESVQYDKLKNWHKKENKEQEQSFRRLFFTENFHSELILLTLAIYRNHKEFGNKINNLLANYLKIEEVVDFKIKFNNPDWSYDRINGINKGAEYLIANINSKEEVPYPFWNIQGKLDKLLTRFYNHQIENSREPLIYPNEDKEDARKFVKEFLEFDSIKFDKFIEEISEYFPHPIDFFDALEATSIVEIFNAVRLKVKKEGVELPIEFNQLSEGEQQLMTVLGLVLVTGKDDCLFLLDEPDTHLNPLWQRDYIKLLHDFNLNDTNSHIIVATHSPLIVQAAEDDTDIFLYRKDKDGNIRIDYNDLKIHNWRIDQVLASDYFEFPSTRPPSLDNYMILREKIINEGEMSGQIKAQLAEFENEFGVLPTGETKEEIESMMIIKSITDSYRDQNDKDPEA